MVLNLGLSDRRPAFPCCSCDLRALFRQAKAICGNNFPGAALSATGKNLQAFTGSTPFPLDYGARHVGASVYRFLAEGRSSVQLGDVPLDRRPGADRINHLPHYSRLLFPGLLVHLAGQNRSTGFMEADPAILWPPRASPEEVREISV